jgi:predicted esterase
MAAKLAATNNPKMLILKAPYYNFTDLVHQHYKIVPGFLIKYKLKTNEYITNVSAPIVIFHGNDDQIINYNSSVKLSKLLKKTDRFITLKKGIHNGMNDNIDYRKNINEILK